MLYRVFDAAELPALVSAFMDGYEVVAPVKRGAHYSFEAISSPDEMDLAYDTTLASPKRYFLPPTETLMRYNAATNEVADFQEEVVPRVIFATLIVGVSCSPDSDCFCNLWDADEARFGYDLFLHRLGDKFLVSISSVEAANILESAVDLRDATNEDRIEFRHATRARQAAFNPEIPEIQDVAMLMDAFHSDPFWEELGSKCLACNACAAVCPTCFCFDIQDVLDPDGQTGERQRIWDACTSPQFAVVAGGHNFRPTGRERVRHRMYHKLNGFLATYDRMLCVGCGRCVKACKADINPIRVLEFFEKKGAEGAC